MVLGTIILFTENLERQRRFYEGALGLRAVEESEGWVRYDAGGCGLALHAIPGPKEPLPDPAPPREDSYHKVAFFVNDVDAERARLVAAGVRMRDIVRWSGMSFCDGFDAEGNVFQISSRPPVR
jgi:catechol 2,3-dioxygenase-like lactoylglutathione lyase family enzyme